MDHYSGVDLDNPERTWLTWHILLWAREIGLAFTRRHALLRLHPLDKSSFRIANGAANLDEGRPITAHARLGQPREADLEKLGRFLGREKNNNRRGRLRQRYGAFKGGLRCHFRKFPNLALLRPRAPWPGPPCHKRQSGDPSGLNHIDKYA
jgi:hypothetical protein